MSRDKMLVLTKELCQRNYKTDILLETYKGMDEDAGRKNWRLSADLRQPRLKEKELLVKISMHPVLQILNNYIFV